MLLVAWWWSTCSCVDLVVVNMLLCGFVVSTCPSTDGALQCGALQHALHGGALQHVLQHALHGGWPFCFLAR
ncbi:unnamed protein product [Meloidogyne enterolobii]|uniref:Uncharacterized protein n=1 Tax=Meloidogyne enterolobii TaxID=390850 RepID=A0ACB1AKI2_MELEN